MIEIRFHGRGGQGAVTAASLLAKAVGNDDKYAQGFPAFGVERRGAPVKAFTRISDEPITIRSHVYHPDYVVVLDSSLMDLPEIFEGVKDSTVIIVNDKEVHNNRNKTYAFDATALALRIIGKDIVNTAMLGVFAKVTNLVSLDSLEKTMEDFPHRLADLNKKVVKEAYQRMEV